MEVIDRGGSPGRPEEYGVLWHLCHLWPGAGLVTGTGMDTEMGKIAALLKSTSEKKTPLQVSLDQFGKKLSSAF